MKKVIYGAIVLLLTGCAARTPVPADLPQTHTVQWEENVRALDLPGAFAEEETLPAADVLALDIDGEETAQALVAQQAGPKIDLYFYYMNRWYKEQQAVFILKTRRLRARPQQGNIYEVTCTAAARTGVDDAHTHAVTFPCGVWKADIGMRIVLPQDKKAEDIWAESF